MSQYWIDDTFAAGHVAQTDLQNIENNFAALKSSFSGAAAPANTVAGMIWFDTISGANLKPVCKIRNGPDTAWYGLMHGDVSEKRLVYRDAAMDGYARDAGVTDKVIALKGGATYVAGAATAGSWTLAGFTAHNHQWYDFRAGAVNDHSYNSAGTNTVIAWAAAGADAIEKATVGVIGIGADQYTDNHTQVHEGTDRIAAAVCILIYLDL